MKTRKPADLNDFELIRDQKKYKFLTIAMFIAIAILIVSGIFFSSQKGFSATSVMPIAFLPILIVNITTWNALKKEIKLRNLKA